MTFFCCKAGGCHHAEMRGSLLQPDWYPKKDRTSCFTDTNYLWVQRCEPFLIHTNGAQEYIVPANQGYCLLRVWVGLLGR